MRSLFTGLLITGLVSLASAQRTIGTISMQLSFPQGEYQASDGTIGVGIKGSVLHRIAENVPISIGGEIGYLVAGSTSKDFDLFYLGYYDTYRISASNNIVPIAFKVRADLVANRDKMQAFVDLTLGTNLFYSSVNVERETYFGNSQIIDGNSTKSYWAFVAGPGFGIEIPLGKRRLAFLLLKGAYLYGSNTKYFTDPYITNNGEVYFTRKESKTSVVTFDIGVRFGFFKNR